MRQLHLEELLRLLSEYCLTQYTEEPNKLQIDLCDGRQIMLPFPRATKMAPARTSRPARSHSPDFRSVSWDGEEYSFNSTQAAVVNLLWQGFEDAAPDVGMGTLLEAAEQRTGRLRDVFRDHPAWGTLIVSQVRGTYRLNDAD